MTTTNEHEFYRDAGVTVTSSRFMVRGETYALAGITSVKELVEPASRRGPMILGAIGLIFLLAKDIFIIGVIFLIVAFLWWRSLKDVYFVLIQSASGTSRALRDYDHQRIRNVVAALNEAIVHRG